MPPLRQIVTIVLATCAMLGLIGVSAGAFVVLSGIYDVAANTQHPEWVFRIIETALNRSVTRHARGIVPPDLSKPNLIRLGMPLYREHCASCHGEPGIAPRTSAMGMTPLPPPMVSPARELPPHEIFWVIKNGIKMTGMPGWERKLDDQQIWSIVSFVTYLPKISPAAYSDALTRPDAAQAFINHVTGDPAKMVTLVGNDGTRQPVPVNAAPATRPFASGTITTADASMGNQGWHEVRPPLKVGEQHAAVCESSMAGCVHSLSVPKDFGEPNRGRVALRQFACTSCHEIEGVVGRPARVGPYLRRGRRYNWIAGVAPNNLENMVLWIRHAPQIKPHTAMPDMGVDEQSARDMVAFLYGAR